MMQNTKLFGKIEIVWTRSSNLLKILVIVLIVFSMMALAALTWVQMGIRTQTEKMRQEAAALEGRNETLEQRVESADAIDTILDVAKEELGLVHPDSVIIQPEK